MNDTDWRFLSTLMWASGAALIVGGYLFAFTREGAAFIVIGCGLSVAGILLRTRAPRAVALLGGALVCAAFVIPFA